MADGALTFVVPNPTGDNELDVLRMILGQLEQLDPWARGRILRYVTTRIACEPGGGEQENH